MSVGFDLTHKRTDRLLQGRSSGTSLKSFHPVQDKRASAPAKGAGHDHRILTVLLSVVHHYSEAGRSS